jgi:hypothetical protein
MDEDRFERDRAMVDAMREVGEPDSVIEGFLLCLDDISDGDRERLREAVGLEKVAAADIASGDVIAMNPLTSQPQRAKPR